jgi:hypothetical protein
MEERVVVLVGYDEAELLDIACVTTSLITANRLGASPAYAVSVATPGGRELSSMVCAVSGTGWRLVGAS